MRGLRREKNTTVYCSSETLSQVLFYFVDYLKALFQVPSYFVEYLSLLPCYGVPQGSVLDPLPVAEYLKTLYQLPFDFEEHLKALAQVLFCFVEYLKAVS